MTGQSRWRGRVSLTIRIGIAVAIVSWIVRKAGIDAIAGTFRQADPWFLLLAFIAMALESIAKVWNWARILDALGHATIRVRLVHAYLVAAFMGSLLPSTASTDALRAVMAQRAFGGRLSSYAASIVTQNGLGWIASCAIGILSVCLLFAGDQAPTYTLLVAVLFAGVVLAGVGFYLVLKHYRGLLLITLRRVFRRRWLGLRRAIRRFADALLVFERAHARFAPLAVGSMIASLLAALAFALIAASVGIGLPIMVWGVVLPLVSLFGILPISISGIGGAQAVHVFLLAPFGVPVSQAFAVSALYAILCVVFNLIFGALAWVLGPSPIAGRGADAAIGGENAQEFKASESSGETLR